MKPHVLVAVDQFTDTHMDEMERALSGWATCERIARHSSDGVYAERMAKAQIMVGWPKPQLLASSCVELLQLGSVGYETYMNKGLHLKERFHLCNAAGVMSVGVAEHFVALMMALTRRLPSHIRDMRHRRWERLTDYAEVAESTACIVGVGDIGTEIARRCAGLGMRVIGVRKNAMRKHSLVESIYSSEKLKEAVAGADHVVLVLPADPNNEGMFDSRIFGAMKKGAYFYNLARGSLVDESELIVCLRTGHLAGAGLDVFAEEPLSATSPLWEMDNVIVTPHCGGRSSKEFDRLCRLFIANALHYRGNKAYINRVTLV